MSELESESSRVKTKQEYSRNVKKLKVKLLNVRNEIEIIQRKVQTLTHTSNDKLIALKITKFCKERRFTPEMLFRFADRSGSQSISKIQFQDTLARIGLKLSKEQMMRLEYLIDEDLSGSISKRQYSAYLDAFGIKKQFTPGQTTAKDIMQKLDIDKLIRSDSDGDSRNKDKRAILLNYQDFLKYCHKHYKQLKDKEVATVFQRLQRNQLINLQHFLDYLEDQKQQRKKQQDKNKKKLKKGESMMTDSTVMNSSNSLKGLILALFRSRSKKSGPLFHSSQFIRLERLLSRSRGELTTIFKAIDSKHRSSGNAAATAYRGSFGYNQLINYFIDHEEKSPDLGFAFELMGHKLAAFKHSPDSVLSQYTQRSQKMTEGQLQKCFQIQFQLIQREYEILSKIVPRQQPSTDINMIKLIELMRVSEGKGMVFIRPDLTTTRLVFRSGLMALRCCLELEQKLISAKMGHWDDCEFGPTENDQYGNDSIDLPLPVEQVVWEKVSRLGMMEFYEPGVARLGQANNSTVCPHELLGQSLWGLARAQENWVYPSTKPDSAAKEITPKEVYHLFSGVYPYVFHSFAKYGIYVLRVWVQQRWRYVVIDDKVPCGLDGRPYFSASHNLRHSFVSLVEKALAKMYGSYKAAFEVKSIQRYLMELTGALCLEETLAEGMGEAVKESVWGQFMYAFKVQSQGHNQAKKSQIKDVMLGLFKGRRDGIDSTLPLNMPLRVNYAFQIPDQTKKNKHRTHRLLVMAPGIELREERQWNKKWSKLVPDNKYQLSKAIMKETCSVTLINDTESVFLNYQLFRKGFNLMRLRQVDWELNIVLRKELQFEQQHRCRYEITAKSTDLELVVYLKQQNHQPQARVGVDFKKIEEGAQLVSGQSSLKNVTSMFSMKFEKDKTVVLEFFVENWKADGQYSYGLTFYFSHPRFDLKQRDRHLLFRYVSPFEEESKIVWNDFGKEERQYIYRNFHKAAEPRGCCGYL